MMKIVFSVICCVLASAMLIEGQTWTPWYDGDDMSATEDLETMSEEQDLSSTCDGGQPIGAQCRVKGTANTITSWSGSAPELLTVPCSSTEGVLCENDQGSDGYCSDYEVRYMCPTTEDLTEIVPTGSARCTVSGYSGECCGKYSFKVKLGFFKKRYSIEGCVKGKYMPSKNQIQLSATFNRRTIFNKNISVRNPPEICSPVPHIPSGRVCVDVTNVKIDTGTKKFHACLALKAKVARFTLLKVHIGCFGS